MDKLRQELNDLIKKDKILKSQMIEITKRLQKKCRHTRLEKSGGGMWHEWPDYGHYPINYECLDCGKKYIERYGSIELDKFVTVDYSR